MGNNTDLIGCEAVPRRDGPSFNRDVVRTDTAGRGGPSFNVIAAALPHEPILSVVPSGSSARIDLSNTLFQRVLSTRVNVRLRRARLLWLSLAAACFWLGQCIIAVIPFIGNDAGFSIAGIIVAYIGALFSLPALLLSTGNLNVGMLRLLVSESEFRCGLVLNTIQWIVVATLFDFDCRAVVCAVEWWVVQLALAVDADVRLCGQRFRTTLVACLATIICFSYSLSGVFGRSFQPLFTFNGQSSSMNDLLQWTAPTLCVIMMKNVYLSSRRRATDQALTSTTVIVYCSTVKARLMLMKVSDDDSSRHTSSHRSDSLLGTPVARSATTLTYIDVTHTFVSTPFPLPHEGMSTRSLAFFSSTGTVSFTGTCIATFLLEIHIVAQSTSLVAPTIAIGSLLGTILFCGLTARFYHRELLQELWWTFDVVFLSMQFCIGAILMCELCTWGMRTVVLVSWTLWFHWLLCFDALTPPVRNYLRLKKVAVTPIALFLLYGLSGPFVLLYGYTNTKLIDRVVVANIRLATLLLSRVLTLWLSFAHLVWDFGVRDDGEFIFLKHLVQYAVPRDSLLSYNQRVGPSARAVVPAESISLLPSATTTMKAASSPLSSPSPQG